MIRAMVGAALAAWVVGATAGDKVWRYVDERTGEVSYSNVPIKGRKADRQVEIMDYPTQAPALARPAGASVGAQGAPIPADVLRQIQAGGPLPVKLPPLPGSPAAGASPSPAQAPGPAAKAPAQSPAAAPRPWAIKSAAASSEPSWAKEVSSPAQAPLWAQEPAQEQ